MVVNGLITQLLPYVVTMFIVFIVFVLVLQFYFTLHRNKSVLICIHYCELFFPLLMPSLKHEVKFDLRLYLACFKNNHV